MQTDITPRINSSLVGRYVGSSVRVVGTVIGQQGNRVHLQGSDGGTVVVNRSPQGTLKPGDIVEVLGRVNPDKSLTEKSFSSFSDKFGKPSATKVTKMNSLFTKKSIMTDLSNYEALVQFAHQAELRDIFGTA